MRSATFLVALVVLVCGCGVVTNYANASVPHTYTNDNFFTSEQDAPVWFVQDLLGNFSGVTATGKTFFQRRVVAEISVQLQHFSIDSANFYISGKGIIMAESDTTALSIYLSRVGWVG